MGLKDWVTLAANCGPFACYPKPFYHLAAFCTWPQICDAGQKYGCRVGAANTAEHLLNNRL